MYVVKAGIGGEHHRYYKHTKFRQNLRGDPKFLVDLTQNDPHLINRHKTVCNILMVCSNLSYFQFLGTLMYLLHL